MNEYATKLIAILQWANIALLLCIVVSQRRIRILLDRNRRRLEALNDLANGRTKPRPLRQPRNVDGSEFNYYDHD